MAYKLMQPFFTLDKPTVEKLQLFRRYPSLRHTCADLVKHRRSRLKNC